MESPGTAVDARNRHGCTTGGAISAEGAAPFAPAATLPLSRSDRSLAHSVSISATASSSAVIVRVQDAIVQAVSSGTAARTQWLLQRAMRCHSTRQQVHCCDCDACFLSVQCSYGRCRLAMRWLTANCTPEFGIRPQRRTPSWGHSRFRVAFRVCAVHTTCAPL